ncbi:MAG: PKD domain-containing protein, partial [Candidatus Hadarchaeum sp.]
MPTVRKLTGGQTLVQRVRVADRDVNWYGIRVDNFALKHLGTAGGNDLVRIEIWVKNEKIFAPGWMYSLEALKSGWVICALTNPYHISDEGETVFEIRYTFASGISPNNQGKTFQPSVRIYCSEGWLKCYDNEDDCEWVGYWYTNGPADYPAAIELVTSLEPTGLEKVENIVISGGNVFDGQRFLAQRVLLEDKDDDTYDVVVHPVHVRNAGNAADAQIAKIEVSRTDTGTLLGQTTTTAGLGSGGVTIPTTAQNVVKDESQIELEIWVTLVGATNLVAGKTIRLETTVFHTEGGKSFSKSAGLGATFTTAINQPPTGVDFSFTPTNPRWDQEITFTPSANIRDPDGEISKATFKWEFGDGKTETTIGRKDVKHTYNQGGSFTVKLTVIDEHGASAATSKTVNVSNAPPTGLDFSFSPTTPRWDQEVTFTPSSAIIDPDGDINKATFKWDFGDGKVVTTVGRQDVKHTYGKGGEFTVSLTVTDAGGQSASTSKKITVTNEAPVNIDFSWTPESPKAGQKVTFKPSANIQDPDGDIQKATFKWEFGDNTSQTIVGPKEVEHTYAEGKTYTVKLTVTDEAGKSASPVQKEIIVRPKGLDFSWVPAQPKVGQTVTFTPDVSDITSPRSFSWDFGDGSVSDARQPTHVYQKDGTFKVSLKVIDAQGKEWKAEKNISVSPASAPVVTALSANPSTPREGEEVIFTASVSSPDAPVVEWEWDFNGDGVVDSRNPSPVKYTYAEKGLYTVKVRVRSQYGGWSAWKSLDLYVAPKTGSLIGTKVLDNPATTQCRIQIFGPPTATKVQIIILDIAGRVILPKDIALGTFTWDLKDTNGQLVPSGLYLYFVTAEVEGKSERSE